MTPARSPANRSDMLDIRPVGYVIGLLVAVLGASMVVPFMADVIEGKGALGTFGLSAMITTMTGAMVTLACADERQQGLSLQQTFLLTTGTWLLLPVFGALPFWIGAPNASYTDAFFEAMSGLTTTGATVFSGLDDMPAGTLLWRALLQWFGGVGIIVVALAFLPSLKVGGMQIFRSEGFDTFGKILPRAAEIAASVSWIYLGVTLACLLGYTWAGMSGFEALLHALTTVSTGGFSNHDASIGHYAGNVEYVAVVFMLIASLPFVRFVQLISGTAQPLLHDSQIRSYFIVIGVVVALLTLHVRFSVGEEWEVAFRQVLFNTVSIVSGTGYASTDYQLWGPFAISIFFLIGLIGGCAGSTACSVKIFRYELLFAALRSQIRRIHNPSGIFTPRYEGRPISDDIMNSVMAFFVVFLLSLGMIAIVLSLMGLPPVTAVSGAASALANIGPGLGEEIGPAGNYGGLPDGAKWVLAMAMLLGRLELMSVFVLFTAAFWRQ